LETSPLSTKGVCNRKGSPKAALIFFVLVYPRKPASIRGEEVGDRGEEVGEEI